MLSNLMKLESNNSLRLAKPSRELVYAFGKGDLDISGSTMDFLMYLSPYIDLDGRIVLPIEQCRFDLHMQHNTYERVMREALHHKLIYRLNNSYYSNFHVHTDGSEGKFEYVKLISAYSSAEVLNYSLRYKRLFYYFASVTRMGNWLNINIENLYNNKLHKAGVGIEYFDDCRQIADALLTLVQNRHIEVRIFDSNKGTVLNAESQFTETLLHSYFDFTNNRKSRTSKLKCDNHLIQVRLSSNVVKDELKLAASETEFMLLAKANNIPYNELQSDSINYIFGFKNELFKIFGNTGLAIYRKSIQAFMEENYFNIEHYDTMGSLTNHFMNFYILKEVRDIVSASAYNQKQMHFNLTYDTTMICHGYKINFETVGKLLSYYMEKGTMNHKVLLDGYMLNNNIEYSMLKYNHRLWLDLANTVTTEYEYRLLSISTNNNSAQYTKQEWREFMVTNAEQGMFMKKAEFDRLLGKLKKQLATSKPRKVKRVPFYNWLEIRE